MADDAKEKKPETSSSLKWIGAITALIVAVTGVITAVNQTGLLGGKKDPPKPQPAPPPVQVNVMTGNVAAVAPASAPTSAPAEFVDWKVTEARIREEFREMYGETDELLAVERIGEPKRFRYQAKGTDADAFESGDYYHQKIQTKRVVRKSGNVYEEKNSVVYRRDGGEWVFERVTVSGPLPY